VTEATGKRERRRKQLLIDHGKKRGFCKLKEEALDALYEELTLIRCRGRVVRQTPE